MFYADKDEIRKWARGAGYVAVTLATELILFAVWWWR